MKQLFKRVKARALAAGPAFRGVLCGVFGLAVMLAACAAAPAYGAVRELPTRAMRDLRGGLWPWYICAYQHYADECVLCANQECNIPNCCVDESYQWFRSCHNAHGWLTCSAWVLSPPCTQSVLPCALLYNHIECNCSDMGALVGWCQTSQCIPC
jgi:hypothetical protein